MRVTTELSYARVLAGLDWAKAATMERIMPMGSICGCCAGQEQTTRIPFNPPLTEPAHLRPALVALAQQANAIDTRRSSGLNEVNNE